MNNYDICMFPDCPATFNDKPSRFCPQHRQEVEQRLLEEAREINKKDEILKLKLLVRKLYMNVTKVCCVNCKATAGLNYIEMREICDHCNSAVIEEAEEVLQAAGMIETPKKDYPEEYYEDC